MAASVHPLAPEHLPRFFAAPGETDTAMVFMGIILVLALLGVGVLFLHLHTLPERMAHKAHKLQFEIVAVLGLLALFTGIHLFWVIGLLLALIDIPDFGGAAGRMAGALEKIAGIQPGKGAENVPDDPYAPTEPPTEPPAVIVADTDGTTPPATSSEPVAAASRGDA